MTDKKVKDKKNNERSDEINVSKCKYFNNGWCLLSESCDAIKYRPCGDMTLIDCYYRNWQRKEQECEELKKELTSFMNGDYCANGCSLRQQLDKLKKNLAEIKEIAEENIRIADLEGLNGVYRRGLAKQILQKSANGEFENDR